MCKITKPKVKSMTKPIICLPMRTFHNVKSPIMQYVKNGTIEILLDRDFVDIDDFSWIKEVVEKAKKLKGKDVHFVIVGHPLVSLVSIYALSKVASKLTIYAWNKEDKNYVQLEYPFEEALKE